MVLDTYTHTVPFAQLGFDANAMGDVNDDSRVDYLLTAANDSGGSGKVYLVAGNIEPFSLADQDLDGDVDLADLNKLHLCLAGPADPITNNCDRADIDASGTTDLGDFAEVQQLFVE
ncbi:MAG: hypothetical protein GY778_06345 [bacterium]|nr:hypothetical protein [bacterium]